MYTLLSQSYLSAHSATPGNHFSKWAKTNDEKSLERRQAHMRILNISYKERKTNILVNNLINKKVGSYVPLLDIIMRRKMTKFGHITRHDSMSKTILQGYVEGNRKRVRPKKNWLNDIFEYYNLPLQQF